MSTNSSLSNVPHSGGNSFVLPLPVDSSLKSELQRKIRETVEHEVIFKRAVEDVNKEDFSSAVNAIERAQIPCSTEEKSTKETFALFLQQALERVKKTREECNLQLTKLQESERGKLIQPDSIIHSGGHGRPGMRVLGYGKTLAKALPTVSVLAYGAVRTYLDEVRLSGMFSIPTAVSSVGVLGTASLVVLSTMGVLKLMGRNIPKSNDGAVPSVPMVPSSLPPPSAALPTALEAASTKPSIPVPSLPVSSPPLPLTQPIKSGVSTEAPSPPPPPPLETSLSAASTPAPEIEKSEKARSPLRQLRRRDRPLSEKKVGEFIQHKLKEQGESKLARKASRKLHKEAVIKDEDKDQPTIVKEEETK